MISHRSAKVPEIRRIHEGKQIVCRRKATDKLVSGVGGINLLEEDGVTWERHLPKRSRCLRDRSATTATPVYPTVWPRTASEIQCYGYPRATDLPETHARSSHAIVDTFLPVRGTRLNCSNAAGREGSSGSLGEYLTNTEN